VQTHQRPVADSAGEETLRRQREVPGEMLLFLAGNEERNRIVVDEYVRDPRRWGKSAGCCAAPRRVR
jgi:hypothetical protein